MANEFLRNSESLFEIAPALRVLNLRKAQRFFPEILEVESLSQIRSLNLRLADLRQKRSAALPTVSLYRS